MSEVVPLIPYDHCDSLSFSFTPHMAVPGVDLIDVLGLYPEWIEGPGESGTAAKDRDPRIVRG